MHDSETSEWVSVAEEDYQLALKAIRSRKYPLRRGACYHAQQCAEKYLKAFLIWRGQRFPFTHDLLALVDLCTAVDPLFVIDEQILRRLNPFAIDVRYPGEEPSPEQARLAVADMKAVRRFVREKLGLG